MKETSKEENGNVRRKALIKTMLVVIYLVIWAIGVALTIVTEHVFFLTIAISPFMIFAIFLMMAIIQGIYEIFLFKEEEENQK